MTGTSAAQPQRRRLVLAVFFFLVFFVLTGATAKDYGISWDEPAYFHASDLHVVWLRELAANLARQDLRNSFDDASIKNAWRWDPYHVPHPPFSRIVSGITQTISSGLLDKFSGYRLGPALFFAILIATVYLWISEVFGDLAGVFSALASVAIPNLFGFAHLAVTDLPLASIWFLTAYCFWKGLRSWKWSVGLGVAWGLALATKFPALFIPLPLILWAQVFCRHRYANNVFTMVFVSPVVAVLVQPYLWHQPGLRFLEFLYEGLSRGYRADTNFTIYFLGRNLFTNQLPWYYPFFMVAVTTPEAILALALFALVCTPVLREQRSVILLLTFNIVFILLLGLLPGAVLHDGVRQLLSALPFLGAMAGAGCFLLVRWLVLLTARAQPLQQIQNLPAKLSTAVMAIFLLSPALDLYLSHPFQLSYYNRLVGGIRGAYARGLDVTYFMEALTPEFVQSLNEHLPVNATVYASVAGFMCEYYQREGRLRRDIVVKRTPPADYVLLLNRQSVLPPAQRALFRYVKPTLAIDLAGVPLVSVFQAPQYR